MTPSARPAATGPWSSAYSTGPVKGAVCVYSRHVSVCVNIRQDAISGFLESRPQASPHFGLLILSFHVG